MLKIADNFHYHVRLRYYGTAVVYPSVLLVKLRFPAVCIPVYLTLRSSNEYRWLNHLEFEGE
jgi:hypothetical protein